MDGIQFARAKQRPPVVLAVDETNRILQKLHGVDGLIVSLLYGSGLRVSEALSLRIQDVGLTITAYTFDWAKAEKTAWLLSQTVCGTLWPHKEKCVSGPSQRY